MKKLCVILAGVFLVLGISAQSHAVPVLYDNEATFLAQWADLITYDFEQSSGFPPAPSDIGMFDGINFHASVGGYPGSTSGTQVMTSSASDTFFGPAIIEFYLLSSKPHGFGFWGLDLIHAYDEVIQVSVDFTTATDMVYDVTLKPGDSDLTPIYFGLADLDDTIESIQFYGTDSRNNERAWAIDDFTVGTQPVPEPGTMLLLGSGLLGLAGFRRRLRQR